MTSEVVILNRGAVAIAADSAVSMGELGSKIYNTANKLFPLSTVEPVAVMVYGVGSFCSLPWETVIKEHRRELGETTLGTVEDYATSLVEYLAKLVPHVPQKEQRDRVRLTAVWELEMIRMAVTGLLEKNFPANHHPSDLEVCAEILEEINGRIEELEQHKFIPGLSASGVGTQLNKAIRNWSDFVDKALAGLTTNSTIKRRARVMVRASLRATHQSPWVSGMVVVGFGKEQLLPALSHYLVDGVVADRVRVWQVNEVQIGLDQNAGIYPFAQEDMVATFMDGIDPAYRIALNGFVSETISRFAEFFAKRVQGALSTKEHAQLHSEMENARRAIVRGFQESLRAYREKENSGPIMSIVEWLPKEELAEMAETLVNLTSFKRRVTPEAETVGGPVDVAVISKGDGLVWIKRKHYFVPELNPRYFESTQVKRSSGIV